MTKPDAVRPQTLIRAAVAQDAAQIAALGMHVWLHTYATGGVSRDMAHYVRDTFTEQNMARAIGDARRRVLVAEIAQNMVAYGVALTGQACPERPALRAELTTLYVQAPFQGQGLGTTLLNGLEQWVAQRTGAGLWLTVNAMNHKAVQFYARHGYTQAGTTYFALGDTQHENHVLVRESGSLSQGIATQQTSDD